MRILERLIVRLLRIEMEKPSKQSAGARKNGINLTMTNKVLNGARRPTEKIIRAFGLGTVVVFD